VPTRRPFLAALLASLFTVPALAQPTSYPNRTVRLIVAFAPGGPTDILARVVATGLGRALGQQVIVDNRAGSGGTLGTREAARATPDGYTLIFAGDAALSVQPQLGGAAAGYDAQKDFTPLRLVASQANVLVVNASKGITDIPTLIARAKARSGAIAFGSAGSGSPSHLVGALFESQTGIDMLHVPYKGAAPAMTDLLGGQFDALFVGTPVALQMTGRKELLMLAITGDRRNRDLPNVPTFAEAGVRGLGSETSIWWAVMGPAGLPPAVTSRLESALEATLADPEVQKGLVTQGVETLNLDAKTTQQWIARDQAKWGALIRAKKIAAD
jgi:tripartite-type tricarboxylate transporter receptor subunit TctC